MGAASSYIFGSGRGQGCGYCDNSRTFTSRITFPPAFPFCLTNVQSNTPARKLLGKLFQRVGRANRDLRTLVSSVEAGKPGNSLVE